MLANKQKEIKSGKGFVRIGSFSSDEKLATVWHDFLYTITHMSGDSIKASLKRGLVSFEQFIIRQFDGFGKKFATVESVVSGRNLPRNRGSVSFFLKNIEAYKKSVSKEKTR